jgi:hypothetical protein
VWRLQPLGISRVKPAQYDEKSLNALPLPLELLASDELDERAGNRGRAGWRSSLDRLAT